MKSEQTNGLHCLMAEFDSPAELVNAAREARKAGYTCLDAFTPFPVEELAEAMDLPRSPIPWWMLAGGAAGFATGLAMQSFASVLDYPMNVGGRALFSWPAFVPVTFELTILFAAFAGLFGLLWKAGLPRLYHAVFNHPGFERASSDGFFLAISAGDAKFDTEQTRRFLESLNPRSVVEVPE